ncbi:MAG: GNAT family N-acetyltransferase [Bacteroidia bacterium]
MKIIKIDSSQQLVKCAELLVNAYNSEPWNDKWTNEKALEKLMCFYNSPKFHGWMAFNGNELLGCCIGNIEPYFSGDYFYLKEMFVSFGSQHKGVGRQLMAHLKRELDKMDISTIILFTSKEFFPFEFYEKTGFNEMDGMRMMHFGSSE